MDIKDLMKMTAQADAVYREVRRHEDIYRLIDLRRDSALELAIKNAALPSYATKGLNDLLYPSSISGVAKHFLALEDRVAAISKIDLLGDDAVRAAALDSLGAKKNFLTAQCGVNFEDLFNRESVIKQLVSAGTVANAFLPTKTELLNVATSITSPWIDSANPLRSIEGVACLATLAKAINVSPFSKTAKGAISALIGDWGNLDSLAAIPKDWIDRKEFYFAHGFDRRLTELPEPAFTQSLYRTELLRPDLFSPVFPQGGDDYSTIIAVAPPEESKEEESEEAAVKRRMLEAYDLLFNLETQLREYIVEVMTRKCGAKWMKQRIPGDMRQQWVGKKEIAVSKGEGELPLIWYADFSDYVQIIIRKDNWNDLFESIFFNAIDVQASFQRLQPLRICTMHARPISQEDLLLITVETHRILRTIGKIKGSAR